tara:strand:+ start:53 stop:247 length:195 start_codon:yes stop_codon:yes gene_type:complete
MEQARRDKSTKGQNEKQSWSNNVDEESYWRDFMRGKSLEKYGVRTVTTYYIDKLIVSELMIGMY